MPSNPPNHSGFLQNPGFGPSDLGYAAMNFEPMLAPNTSLLFTAGRLNLAKLWLPGPVQINNIHAVMTVIGVTLTAGQCFACVYDSAFNLVAVTADQAAAWVGGLGVLTMPVATSALIAGPPYIVDTPYCYVGGFFNGTTSPTFRSAAPSLGINGIASVANSRTILADTGLTTAPPARMTPGAISNAMHWWGIS